MSPPERAQGNLAPDEDFWHSGLPSRTQTRTLPAS